MMGACGADDDAGLLLRQMFRKLRFQMIADTTPSLRHSEHSELSATYRENLSGWKSRPKNHFQETHSLPKGVKASTVAQDLYYQRTPMNK